VNPFEVFCDILRAIALSGDILSINISVLKGMFFAIQGT
jgi:hypothetical protein